jgi:CRP-like cAMP-binding protein
MSTFAFTRAEFIFLVFAQLAVGLIYGSLAGLMSSFFMNQNAGALEKSAKMDALHAWMDARNFDRETQLEIQQGFEARHGTHTAVFDEREILDELPQTTANRVSCRLYNKYISSVAIFRGLEPELLTQICRLIIPLTFEKEATVFCEGDIGSDLYVVIDGELDVAAGAERLGFLKSGAFCGEGPLIAALRSNIRGQMTRQRTIRTICPSTLGVLGRDALLGLCKNYVSLETRLLMLQKRGRGLVKRKQQKREKRHASRVGGDQVDIVNFHMAIKELNAKVDRGVKEVKELHAKMDAKIDKVLKAMESRQIA